MTTLVVRNAQGYAVAFGPADGTYSPTIPAGHTFAVEENPDLTPPPLTPLQEEEIKRKLLAEAMLRRDVLLGHLRWFYTKSVEEGNAPKTLAISNAINSLHALFSDPRIVNSVDGAAKVAIFIVYKEIFDALKAASLVTYNAIKALDPL